MRRQRLRSLGYGCLLISCLTAGCSSAPTEPPSPAQVNLERLGAAYMMATDRLGHPPKNYKEFQPYLEQQGSAAQILRSPNDGENFEIVWGVELRGLKGQGNDVPVVAYEKRGKDGKRSVLRGRSDVLQLTESELKAATFPPDHRLPF